MPRLDINLNYFFGNTFIKGLYSKYIDQLDLSDSKDVLEFGCGIGSLTKPLLKKLDKDAKLNCIDIDFDAIDFSKKRFKDYNNLCYFVGDIRTLDIQEKSFDTVIIHYMYHDIPAKERKSVLEKINKVMKDGGKIFIREPIKETHGISTTEVRKLMKSCGFVEIKGEMEKKFVGGEMFNAIFIKEKNLLK